MNRRLVAALALVALSGCKQESGAAGKNPPSAAANPSSAAAPASQAAPASAAAPASQAAPTPASVAAPAPSADDPPPATVVATIVDQQVTMAELDQSINAELSQARSEFKTQLQELRRQGLDRLVSDRLLDAEARKRNLANKDALLEQVITANSKPVTDAEIATFYEQNKDKVNGQPLEAVQAGIRQYLSQQGRNKAVGDLLADLKKQNKVKLTLPEIRVPVEAIGPAKGPDDAAVTVVAFSDFQCPFCSRAVPVIDEIVKHYGKDVRIVFRHFPLSFHDKAPGAAKAGICATEQGKFWEMHDLMFKNQQALEETALKGYAAQLGLDAAKFEACLASPETTAKLQKDMDAGSAAGVNGTPAFFVDGISISGAQPFEAFKDVIDRELDRAGRPVPN